MYYNFEKSNIYNRIDLIMENTKLYIVYLKFIIEDLEQAIIIQ